MQATGTAGRQMERGRAEEVVETLARMEHRGQSVVELAHDARNMMTALGLYCDLLEEPGVLTAPHQHYADELRLVAEAGRRLVEKFSLLNGREESGPMVARQGRLFADWPDHPRPIENAHEELLAVRKLLAAMAGPAITLTATASGGALPIAMTGEDLVRILVNLVRNSAEAIPGPGTIEISLNEGRDRDGAQVVVLTLEDSGHGIPPSFLDRVFEPGF